MTFWTFPGELSAAIGFVVELSTYGVIARSNASAVRSEAKDRSLNRVRCQELAERVC